MTMPHMMNCAHSGQGWCLECVVKQGLELEKSVVQKSALADEVERLKPFEEELKLLVDRLGHDGGAVCGWGTETRTAKEWADAVFHAASDNEQFARQHAPSKQPDEELANSPSN